MTRTKFVFVVTLLFVLIFMSMISVYMPKAIEWYFEPPSNIGVSCAPAITWAFDKFQFAQLISAGVGALIGLIVGLRFSSKKTPQIPPVVSTK